MWRFGSIVASATRAVGLPGTNVKPFVGSEMLSWPVNDSSAAFGGLLRTEAPPCEKIDWKSRPWYMPYPPRSDPLPGPPKSLPIQPEFDSGDQAKPTRGS